MNDQLQAQISQILAQIMVSVGEVKDFSVQQLPDIAQQYINYGIWTSGIYSVISFIFLVAFIILAYKCLKRARNDDDYIPLFILPFLLGVLSIVSFFHNLHNFILVMTAPKVWFILELKNLLS